jgi:hypothetical protein
MEKEGNYKGLKWCTRKESPVRRSVISQISIKRAEATA